MILHKATLPRSTFLPFIVLFSLLSLLGCANLALAQAVFHPAYPVHPVSFFPALSWFNLSISHDILTTRDGLAGNFVTSIAQASGGTLWIGTTTGATRISGDHWTTFTHVHGLGDDWITGLAVGPDGHVWFGTHGGLSVFDGKEFTAYSISNSQLPSNFVTALAIEPTGRVWVGTLNSGIAAFDPETKQWIRYSLPNNGITGLALDKDNIVWAGTDDGGLFQFRDKQWQPITIPLSLSKRVQRVENGPSGIKVTMEDGTFLLQNGTWGDVHPSKVELAIAHALGADYPRLTPLLISSPGEILAGSPRGLGIFRLSDSLVSQSSALAFFRQGIRFPGSPLPVVLVHGWTAAESDSFEDSEFRYFKSYAEQDGIPVFYAQGINPKNTLFQNAARLRDDIAAVKKATGADKVNIIAFSMGGLNARAYLESSYYEGDVNHAIILGTPEAGVDIWKPILAEEILEKPDQPSAIELTPEYARLMNAIELPRASIPYDLLVGDARKQPLLEFIGDLPPNDGLIGVDSALSLTGPNVRHALNSDLHGYEPIGIPFHLTSYLYPRDTYERYLRNALRDPINAPIGSEVTLPPTPAAHPDTIVGNHTPVVTTPVAAGATLTRTVVLDANQHARFLAYFPSGEIDFSVKDPSGKVYHSTVQSMIEQALGTGKSDTLALNADIASFTGYSVSNAPPGVWSLILKRTDSGRAQLSVTTYVDLDAALRLSAQVTPNDPAVNQPVLVSATLSQKQAAKVTAHIAVPSSTPGGPFTIQDVALFSDGNGKYSVPFTPPRPGYYLVKVEATGTGFTRGTELLFSVNPGGAQLQRNPSVQVRRDASGGIEHITLQPYVIAERSGAFAAAAILRDPMNRIAARVVAPAQLEVGMNQVTIDLPGRDLAFPGPYSLDLTLLDANWAAIQIDGAENVATIPN